MTVRLTRTTPGQPVHHCGVEVDDTGRARAWQTSGTRVGRFSRALAAEELEELEVAVRAAAGVVVPPPTSYDATVEHVLADGVDLTLDTHAELPAGPAELVTLLRAIGDDLGASPAATIELVVTGPPPTAWLRHVGDEPLTVRCRSLEVRATAFDADSAVVDRAGVTVAAPYDGPAGPGWTLQLGDGIDVTAPAGGFVTVTVARGQVDVLGDGVLLPVELGWLSDE